MKKTTSVIAIGVTLHVCFGLLGWAFGLDMPTAFGLATVPAHTIAFLIVNRPFMTQTMRPPAVGGRATRRRESLEDLLRRGRSGGQSLRTRAILSSLVIGAVAFGMAAFMASGAWQGITSGEVSGRGIRVHSLVEAPGKFWFYISLHVFSAFILSSLCIWCVTYPFRVDEEFRRIDRYLERRARSNYIYNPTSSGDPAKIRTEFEQE